MTRTAMAGPGAQHPRTLQPKHEKNMQIGICCYHVRMLRLSRKRAGERDAAWIQRMDPQARRNTSQSRFYSLVTARTVSRSTWRLTQCSLDIVHVRVPLIESDGPVGRFECAGLAVGSRPHRLIVLPFLLKLACAQMSES